MISGDQIRHARSLLGWTVRELARKANIAKFAVSQIENLERPSQYPGLLAIQLALEAEGIEFRDDDAPSVRLHPKSGLIETLEADRS